MTNRGAVKPRSCDQGHYQNDDMTILATVIDNTTFKKKLCFAANGIKTICLTY